MGGVRFPPDVILEGRSLIDVLLGSGVNEGVLVGEGSSQQNGESFVDVFGDRKHHSI